MNYYKYKKDYLERLIQDLKESDILNFKIINKINGLFKNKIDITINKDLNETLLKKLETILNLYKEIHELILKKYIKAQTLKIKEQLEIFKNYSDNPIEYHNNKVNILSKIIKNDIEQQNYNINELKDMLNNIKLHNEFDKSLGL